MKRPVVLIIRDPALRNQLANGLRRAGRDVTARANAEGWSALVEAQGGCALIAGDDLADGDNVLLVRRARRLAGEISAFAISPDASGNFLATDHDGSPLSAASPAELAAMLSARLDDEENAGLARSAPAAAAAEAGLPAAVAETEWVSRLSGSTPSMKRLLDTIGVVAPTDSTVLIQGESGTGKDLLARLIHERSRRRAMPLIEVHCGAIPPNLMESELFGHEKGAFTGAQMRKPGLCMAADGGTLFLDEIGELPLDMQVKLLRVLQSGWLRPIGATHAVKVDLRVIAATNRDLKEEVRAGRFRLDLFFRLNVISLEVPALRDRADDIPELVAQITAGLARKGIAQANFSAEVLQALREYSWPGNVRELENMIERLLLLYPHGQVPPEERRRQLGEGSIDLGPGGAAASGGAAGATPAPGGAEMTLRELEEMHIRRVLRNCGGNKTRAAQVLGINVKTLYNKMKLAGMRREEFQPARAVAVAEDGINESCRG